MLVGGCIGILGIEPQPNWTAWTEEQVSSAC